MTARKQSDLIFPTKPVSLLTKINLGIWTLLTNLFQCYQLPALSNWRLTTAFVFALQFSVFLFFRNTVPMVVFLFFLFVQFSVWFLHHDMSSILFALYWDEIPVGNEEICIFAAWKNQINEWQCLLTICVCVRFSNMRVFLLILCNFFCQTLKNLNW